MSYTDDDDRTEGRVEERRVEHRNLRDDDSRADDRGVALARERFGGMHVGAQLVGMLTAVALLLLLGGIVGAAIGGIAYETGLDATSTEISLGSVIAGIVVLAIAFLIGGWAAGRMARYDGGRNGLMTAVWFLILGAILAALGVWLGDQYNVTQRVDLPSWFTTWFQRDDVTTGAIVSGIVAIITMLVAGFLGGVLGARWHRRADATIASHRPGGMIREEHVVRRDDLDE